METRGRKSANHAAAEAEVEAIALAAELQAGTIDVQSLTHRTTFFIKPPQLPVSPPGKKGKKKKTILFF